MARGQHFGHWAAAREVEGLDDGVEMMPVFVLYDGLLTAGRCAGKPGMPVTMAMPARRYNGLSSMKSVTSGRRCNLMLIYCLCSRSRRKCSAGALVGYAFDWLYVVGKPPWCSSAVASSAGFGPNHRAPSACGRSNTQPLRRRRNERPARHGCRFDVPRHYAMA